MVKVSCSMINELEMVRYLKENYNVTFVDLPVFTITEICGNEVKSTMHKVNSYRILGTESFETLLSEDGLKHLYVFRDQVSNIIFQSPVTTPQGDKDMTIIRMCPVYGNIRYKLNKKK